MMFSKILKIVHDADRARTLDELFVRRKGEGPFTAVFSVERGNMRWHSLDIHVSSFETLPQEEGAQPQILIEGTSTINGAVHRVVAVYAPTSLGGSGSGFLVAKVMESLETAKAVALFAVIERMMSICRTPPKKSADSQMIDLHTTAQQMFIASNLTELNELQKAVPK